jgi:uncharacterized membrane protein
VIPASRASRRRSGAGRLTVVAGMLLALWGVSGLATRLASAGQPDIYYIWRDGVRLAEGVNPYRYDSPAEPQERPTKHPSYLPLFYLAVAAVYKAGIREYATWLMVWRAVRIGAHVAIAVLLYLAGQRAGRPLLGLFGALFWSLNRWTLYTVRAGSLDEPALLLLLLSMESLEGRPRLACLLLGASLAVKHLGLLVAPLFLVWAWQDSEPAPRAARWRRTAATAVWIGLIPVAVSLPFLWWDAPAFVQSMVSPVIRPAGGYAHVSAVGSLLGLRGGVARVPLLVVACLILFVAASRQVIGRYTTVLLMFAAFTDFNTVLFPQYLAWAIPFIVLAAGERGAARREASGAT